MYLTVNIGTRLQVIQGTRIDLICRVTGFPTPRVNWVKGNVRLEQRFEGQGLFIVPYDENFFLTHQCSVHHPLYLVKIFYFSKYDNCKL